MKVGESAHPTTAWHALTDGRLQCDVCPRACSLHDGQRGLCFVRQRQGDGVVLTTYGRSSGFCVDPIEKKPLNHVLPGSAVLSFGTAGCNLTCRFCQNWDISKSREVDTLADAATPERIARTALDLGCRSVAFTYNDPTIFYEYARDVAIACHEVGAADGLRDGRLHRAGAPRRPVRAHRRGERGPQGVRGGLLPPHLLGAPGARPGDHRVPRAGGGGLDRADHLAHPRPERQRRGAGPDDELGRRPARARTCRCTSPRSTPTSSCSTGRPRRRRPWPGPARSPCATGCATPTPATSTTGPVAPPVPRLRHAW